MKYSIEQIAQWAERYNELLSFSAVGKEFGIEKSVVNRKLRKYRDMFNIKFKEESKKELFNQGKKKCYDCGEIKSVSMFGASLRRFDKIDGRCRICSRKYRDNYATKNPQKEEIWYKKAYKKYNNSIKNHPLGKLRLSIRNGVRRIFKNTKYKEAGHKNIGLKFLCCSIKDFRQYIESLWQPGMTWENYGFYGWHIDHIVPVASIKSINDIDQIKKVCHYTNMCPLWAKENLKKGSKTISEETPDGVS